MSPAAQRALPERARIVIIGGGIMGLATAFELAQLGVRDVVVLEKSYLCSGASGRNGGGVRAQWSSDDNIRLMRSSIDICRHFATTMRINVWFRQGGYLFLARTEDMLSRLRESVLVQQEHGLRTRIVDRAECKKLVPELDTSSILAASYNPDDGVVFPWPFVWGYARACEAHGVPVHPFTEVTGFETDGRRVTAVVTSRGTVRTSMALNATGAFSPQVASLLDVQLPNHPHRHEICSTEPLKPFLRPFVGDLESGLYVSQSMRGELVGGIRNDRVPPGLDQGSSLRFLALYSQALTRAMPVLGGVRVLRQWSGCYDITPDGSPIVGPVAEVEGFVQMCGFMGHGFMMAPIMGRLMARYLTDHPEADQALFEKWNVSRFREGRLLGETMTLG